MDQTASTTTVSLSAEEFLALLDRSKLVRPKRAAEIIGQLDLPKHSTAQEIAQALVSQRVLTRYQANRLLTGRYRGYFYNQYMVLDIIGAGGMGWVYLARDQESRELVALKVLSSYLSDDPGMMARLKLESRAGRRLFHPAIARTIDAGDAAGSHFLVMDYVRGISLRELVLQQGPIPWKLACHLVKQIAEGLHYAHERGLVHRDIKPENFLVNEDSNVKILDFGLALIEGAEEEEFSLSMIFGHDGVGTLDYMAPEQSEDSHHVDRRADIYGLGGTFYSILTGLLPFSVRTTAEKIEAHKERPFPLVRNKFPKIPPEIDQIISKMTAKNPEERYQNAKEVAEALEAFSETKEVEFDYQAVLKIRNEDAQRRMKRAERRLRGGSGTSSTSPPSQTSPILKSTHANMLAETERSIRNEAAERRRQEGSFADRGIEAAKPAARYGRLINTDTGDKIPLHKSQLIIGRGKSADISLDSAMVSTAHCRLIFNGQFWKVNDFESKNGIKVNGEEVTTARLMPGDRLMVAELFQFEIDYLSEWVRKQQKKSSGSGLFLPIVFGSLIILALLAGLLWMLL